MADPFGAVAFLASSENRVRLLETLADGPHTRAELHDKTGVARATLGRNLSDLQSRDWIRKDGIHYEATPEAVHLVDEFGSLLDTIAALDDLGELVGYFPDHEVPFGLDHLRDATVTRPDPQDSTAPVRRGSAALGNADRVVSLTGVYAPPAIEGHHEAVTERGQELNVVFGANAVAVMLDDPEVADFLADLLVADSASIYRYPGPVPYNISLIGETAYIGLSDSNGAPQALIETDDSTVCEWVRETFDEHREDATLLDGDDVLD